ncbi:MAG: hypothetical protein WAM82_25520 [Thermoanaerobaculia bacterium]
MRRVFVAFSLIALTAMSGLSANEATKSPSQEQAESAKTALLKLFGNLKKTPHNTPYAVTIDLATGAMSMDNTAVRWEFNLGDLNPDNIYSRTWHPLGLDQMARTVGAECFGDQPCVTRGESNGSGGYKKDPEKLKAVRFEVYRGEGTAFQRDLDAEGVAAETLATLIRYSRLQKH